MKFAHRYKAELLEQGFPQHWVDSAVPYGELKKVIKKICRELKEYGLDIASFVQLPPEPDKESQSFEGAVRRNSNGAITFQYNIGGSREEFRPKLTLFFEDDMAVDATLSPDTKAFLKNRLSQQGSREGYVQYIDQGVIQDVAEPSQLSKQVSGSGSAGQDKVSTDGPVLRQIEIPLTFDAEFFELLQDDVSHLDAIQAAERKTLTNDILELSKEITALVKPSRFNKTDMYVWRELFDIYLQAGVFFSTTELHTGSRSPASAARQLDWFQNEVNSRALVASFKLRASHRALDQFVKINITLLRNLKFQEINEIAIRKILKKFDKRTNLGVTRVAPTFIRFESIMPQTIAKAVCSQVNNDLVKITPQLDDYLCPICFTIAWRPIRMRCKHIFCVLCTIKMQKQKKKLCPLCREVVILEADADSIDDRHAKFLKKYFPKETREKQIDLEKADGEERFGIFYTHPSDSKCRQM